MGTDELLKAILMALIEQHMDDGQITLNEIINLCLNFDNAFSYRSPLCVKSAEIFLKYCQFMEYTHEDFQKASSRSSCIYFFRIMGIAAADSNFATIPA